MSCFHFHYVFLHLLYNKDINYDYEQFRKYGIVTHYKGIDGFGDSMNDSIHDYLRKNHMSTDFLPKPSSLYISFLCSDK